MKDSKNLISILEKQQGKKILVVGDLMLDRFIYGSVDRISPEAPVPVVKVHTRMDKLGGAGNVAQNIKALGGEPLLVAAVGRDSEADTVRALMRESGLKTTGLVTIETRPTTIKTRIIAERQQVVRLDNENDFRFDDSDTRLIAESITRNMDDIDAVIVSDYNKGLVTEELMARMADELPEGKILAVDPKPSNHRAYKNVSLITPNLKEASEIALQKVDSDDDLLQVAENIFSMLGCGSLLVTLGARGMALFESKESDVKFLSTRAREVFDVTGAGDTVISAYTLALSSGAEMFPAAELANFAAGLVVSKLGTATVTAEEVKEYILSH